MTKYKNVDLTAQRLAARIRNEYKQKHVVTLAGAPYRERVLSVLDAAKIPYDESKSPRQRYVHWDGRTLAASQQTASNLLHELAHFQCARPDMWKYPELGMSCGPDGDDQKALIDHLPHRNGHRYTLPYPECEMDEELHASLLGIMWERHLGGNFYETLASHGWVDCDDKEWDSSDVWEHFKWLLESGFINATGRPNLIFRDGNKHVTLD